MRRSSTRARKIRARQFLRSTVAAREPVAFRTAGEINGMGSDDEVRGRKMAMNQSTFRAVNERLRGFALSHHFLPDQRVPFFCECADEGCYEVVMLRLADYDHVRHHPSRFLLVAGHEDAEAVHEHIVEAEAGYAIVEKVGAAGREAARLDPRRDVA
jgi:hypothetical protein